MMGQVLHYQFLITTASLHAYGPQVKLHMCVTHESQGLIQKFVASGKQGRGRRI